MVGFPRLLNRLDRKDLEEINAELCSESPEFAMAMVKKIDARLDPKRRITEDLDMDDLTQPLLAARNSLGTLGKLPAECGSARPSRDGRALKAAASDCRGVHAHDVEGETPPNHGNLQGSAEAALLPIRLASNRHQRIQCIESAK